MTILENVERDFGVFESINKNADRERLDRFVGVTYQKFCEIFSDNQYLNGIEWTGRHYMASKKIALSSLFYTQAKYLMNMQMQNLSFYACYYALFNGLSALLWMSPNMIFCRASKISHGKLANEVENSFVRSGLLPSEIIKLLGDLRFSRELYSYHLPLTGQVNKCDPWIDAECSFERLTFFLPLVLQATNLISHISHLGWEKKAALTSDEYNLNSDTIDDFFHSLIRLDDVTGSRCHYDDGDYTQLGYYLMKIGRPMPLSWFIDDKMLDTLECGWTKDESTGGYSIESVSQYISDSIGPALPT